MEFHPVKQCAVSDRAGVGGPLAQGFPVTFPAAADVAWRDGGKGHQFHGVDLDLHGTDGIPARELLRRLHDRGQAKMRSQIAQPQT